MKKIQVLIADDHEIVRAGFRRLVDQMDGLDICGEIGDGTELIASLDEKKVDLLIVDLTMPNFEPITTIASIKKAFPELLILIVSAYDDRLYVKQLLEIGVDGYHLKDESLQTLQLAIQRVLAGERWIAGPLIDKLIEKNGDVTNKPALTERQINLMRYLHQGFENKKIASKLGLSIKTVESHLTNIYRKLNVQSRLEAVNYIHRFPEILGIEGELISVKNTSSKKELHDAKISILVLDDSPRFRKQLLYMIGKAQSNVNIYEAETIKEAMRLIEIINFDLVLLDVILQNENGINAARQIHKAKPEIRIILISAYPDREFHKQGLSAGAKAFLDKKNLDLATIRQVLSDVEI